MSNFKLIIDNVDVNEFIIKLTKLNDKIMQENDELSNVIETLNDLYNTYKHINYNNLKLKENYKQLEINCRNINIDKQLEINCINK